jgi:hypothetical protein
MDKGKQREGAKVRRESIYVEFSRADRKIITVENEEKLITLNLNNY